MQVALSPLFSKRNPSAEDCPLGCQGQCKVAAASDLRASNDAPCPLSSHQVETAAAVLSGEVDVIFNSAATGDGKSLGATLPALLNPRFQMNGKALSPQSSLMHHEWSSGRTAKGSCSASATASFRSQARRLKDGSISTNFVMFQRNTARAGRTIEGEDSRRVGRHNAEENCPRLIER